MSKVILILKDPSAAQYIKNYIEKYTPILMSHIKEIHISDDKVKPELKEYFVLEQGVRRCTDCKHYEISPDDSPCNICEESEQFIHK